ncbi:ATP/GTP-binding protein [Gulosibacter sp. 10]|uniref:GTP-binding protein n=1 Tax=Gulosibacter sp. 10 TaxID=1255570 RepID=UPI00097EB5D7|nr:hypothetical protein [Gulosibacter sp. 10]SJM64618.1 hypothetical protein FM112_10365 [Gulosibacter sp. 10]
MSNRTTVIGHRAIRELAFVGPFGVGKTTAVRTLSDIEVANTEVVTSSFRHRAVGGKARTTVGIDYGEWHTPEGIVALYGTPGQARFRILRSRNLPETTRQILLLYGDHEHALEEAREWLSYLDAERLGARLTVGLTRLERGGGPPVVAYRQLLDALFSREIPLFVVDPRKREDVAFLARMAARLPQRAEDRGNG